MLQSVQFLCSKPLFMLTGWWQYLPLSFTSPATTSCGTSWDSVWVFRAVMSLLLLGVLPDVSAWNKTKAPHTEITAKYWQCSLSETFVSVLQWEPWRWLAHWNWSGPRCSPVSCPTASCRHVSALLWPRMDFCPCGGAGDPPFSEMYPFQVRHIMLITLIVLVRRDGYW